ncbi:hypothetical protein ES703_109856 [subsurface metagenome]
MLFFTGCLVQAHVEQIDAVSHHVERVAQLMPHTRSQLPDCRQPLRANQLLLNLLQVSGPLLNNLLQLLIVALERLLQFYLVNGTADSLGKSPGQVIRALKVRTVPGVTYLHAAQYLATHHQVFRYLARRILIVRTLIYPVPQYYPNLRLLRKRHRLRD